MLVANIFLALCTMCNAAYYIFVDGSLEMKAATALTFVLTGAVNLVYCLAKKTQNALYPVLTVLGLVFSMAGDIILDDNFIIGAAVFGAGHVFYFAAYTRLMFFSVKDLVYVLALFVPSSVFIAFSPMFDFGTPVILGVCVIYAVIISFMTGKAVSNFMAHKSAGTFCAALGSILFFFSDLMLVIRFFGGGSGVFGFLCLATYFPAQSLIAHSVYQYQKDGFFLGGKH